MSSGDGTGGEGRGAVWRIGSVGDADDPRTVIELDGALHELDRALADGGVAHPPGATTVRAILQRWDDWRPALDALAAAAPLADDLDARELRWLPPVVPTGNVLCAGANYRDHLAEMGADADKLERPFLFAKPRSALTGHRCEVEIPAQAEWVDWEGELGIVIGRRVRNARGEEARAAIAGYLPFHDVSARDWVETGQLGGTMDMVLHKGFDGFGPCGPLITPAQFVPDPQALSIELDVNGVVKQGSSTAQMVFGVVAIVEHVCSIATLEPGDLIATGSPAGVGYVRTPRERLQAGDVVTLRIDGLGPALETRMVAAGAVGDAARVDGAARAARG
jgi:2,4-diketo-3-deoxy-L-fuconate hydrolase